MLIHKLQTEDDASALCEPSALIQLQEELTRFSIRALKHAETFHWHHHTIVQDYFVHIPCFWLNFHQHLVKGLRDLLKILSYCEVLWASLLAPTAFNAVLRSSVGLQQILIIRTCNHHLPATEPSQIVIDHKNNQGWQSSSDNRQCSTCGRCRGWKLISL